MKKLFWVLLLSYTAFHLGYSVMRYSVFQGTSSGDFNRVYQEAKEWRLTLIPDLKKESLGHPHPPFYYTILLILDTILGGRQNLTYFFYFLQFLLFPLAVVCLAQAAWLGQGSPPLMAYGVATVLVVNFQPFLETLAQHKVEGVEFFLICLGILAFRRKRDMLCGGLVMLAANLKYMPALLLAHFCVKRQWKVLLGSLIGVALVCATLYASFGPQSLSSGFFRQAVGLFIDHKHEGNAPGASVEMQTLSGTVNRWFARPVPPTPFMHYIRVGSYMPVPNPALAFGTAGVLKILAGLGWLFFIRRKWGVQTREGKWQSHLLEISLTLVMIFVISQASRVHYAILVLPAFVFVGLLLVQQGRTFPLREKCLFGLAYTFTGMLIPGGLLNRLPPHPVWEHMYSWMYLWWSLPFYGILLLGVCILLLHHRMQGRAATAPSNQH